MYITNKFICIHINIYIYICIYLYIYIIIIIITINFIINIMIIIIIFEANKLKRNKKTAQSEKLGAEIEAQTSRLYEILHYIASCYIILQYCSMLCYTV